ncbi:hypothetical protein TCSYLVIO_010157, partial [Trypanosoma cruzi]
MRHAGAQFFNHRGNGGYGVTPFARGGHFAHAFMRLPLFHQGSATTIIRTQPGIVLKKSPANLPPAAVGLGEGLRHIIENNRKRIINSTEKASAAVTDASLNGWGAVIIPDPGDVKIAGGEWERRPFLIMQAEARGTLGLIGLFRHLAVHHGRLGGQHFAAGAANKGSSKSHALMWGLRRIYEFLESCGVRASFAYVRSAGFRRRHITRS